MASAYNKQAIEDFSQALQIHPNFAEAFLVWGEIFLQLLRGLL
ncbi:MAG: hypothetical protein ACREPR_03105 [Brasilonema sp.]